MAHDSTSSPDPLASDYSDDPSFNSTLKPSRATATRTCAKVSKFSQNKAGDSSPSKIMAEQILSPWRIRVTVEAERDDEEQNTNSRGGRTQAVTHTMKAPLEADEAVSPTKRRKSSPARVKKGRKKSVTDLDVLVLGDDSESDEWCAKPKSPRRRGGSKTKPSRTSILNKEVGGHGTFDILEDTGAVGVASEGDQQLEKGASPELRQIDPNQVALKARKNSTTNKVADDDTRASTNNARQVSMSSTMTYPTPSSTASEPGHSDQNIPAELPVEQEVGLQTIMESEGFTMIDLDSLSAIKNLRSSPQDVTGTSNSAEFKKTKIGKDEPERSLGTGSSRPSAESSVGSIEDTTMASDLASSPPVQSSSPNCKIYSIGHLQLPSSLRVHRHRHVTPLPPVSELNRSSPPPLPRVTPVVKSSTANSKKAVEAGMALRDAVTPEPECDADFGTKTKDCHSEEDTIFGGFSLDTRRELRAELRFGEELGIRQVERGHLASEKLPTSSMNSQSASPTAVGNIRKDSESMQLNNQARWTDRWQQERDEVIRQAGERRPDQVILIESDQGEHGHEEPVEEEETMGDIWLAEAKNASSSPKEAEEQHSVQPRRKLIPSPWKRGEEIVDNASSYVSGDETISGLLWRTMGHDGNVRFGDDILAHPDRYSSRARHTEDADEQAVCWRNAQDVVDEETELFEEEKGKEQNRSEIWQLTHQDESATNLYETNLEALPEQDLLSPSQMKPSDEIGAGNMDHDSTYSSISDVESISQYYKQRTSLSPSKARPNTPRSAMKGARASFGQALVFDGLEEEKKRVVWARKAACVNELWEESSRSIRSTQDSSLDETPTPIAEEKYTATESKHGHRTSPQSSGVVNLDGSLDGPRDLDPSKSDDGSVVALEQISPVTEELNEVQEHQQSRVGPDQSLDSVTSRSEGSSDPSIRNVPSYLKPPSYPTIPDRDVTQPLATAGDFSNNHFRTLHILYKKSQRPRFHAPRYPDEIRTSIHSLVDNDWRLVVDERKFMGEKFTFSIGVAHARVIERFMQEIEWDWKRRGTKVNWGWSAEQLATQLGRIIVGEAVRADEKAAKARN